MRFHLLFFSLVMLIAGPAKAAEYFWNPSTVSGNWVSTNWSTPTNVPPYTTPWADSNTANFTAASQTISVNNFVTIAGINFTADGITVVSGGGASDLRLSGSVPVSVSASNTATISEDMTSIGAGSALVKQGTGTLVLAGGNSITTVTISSGTLRLGSSSALDSIATSPGLAVNGTLDMAGFSATRGALSGSGTITSSAAGAVTLTVGTGATGTSTFSGIIQNGAGTVALTKIGTGTLVLSNANTYTGATTINGGTLSVSSLANGGVASGIGQSSNAAANLQFDGGTLRYTATSSASINRAFTLNAGGGTIEVQSAFPTLVISGGGTGAGGLTKAGAGILTLTGTNDYTGGTTVSAGVLRIGNGSADGSVTGNFLNNATLQFNNPSATTFTGDISGTGGVTHLATGPLTLTGTNTYAGPTTVNAGTLQIGNGGTTGSITSNVSLSAISSTLGFNRSDDATYNGSVSGAGQLQKAGGGTVILGGSNSYSGTTTVSGGGLYFNGFKSGAGIVDVLAGTFGGVGTIAGATTFNSGATFDIGDGSTAAAISDIALSNALNLLGGSSMRVDVSNASTPTAGTTYDQAIVGGTVSLGGILDVEYDPSGGGAGYSLATQLLIISTPDVVSGVFSNYADGALVPELNGLGGFNWHIQYQSGTGVFFTPVPEPGTVLYVAVAGLGLARWVRRRRAARQTA